MLRPNLSTIQCPLQYRLLSPYSICLLRNLVNLKDFFFYHFFFFLVLVFRMKRKIPVLHFQVSAEKRKDSERIVKVGTAPSLHPSLTFSHARSIGICFSSWFLRLVQFLHHVRKMFMEFELCWILKRADSICAGNTVFWNSTKDGASALSR